MTTSLHPIQLLSRTDASVSTIYHAVFLVQVNGEEVHVLKRIPHKRAHLDTIETGLTLFAMNAVSKAEVESFGSFVITTSDGSRFYTYWNTMKDKLFIVASKLPLLSFSKSMLSLLALEPFDNVLHLLYCLCETPIIPAPGLNYDVKLSSGSASIEFSDIEQVIDSTSNNIVIRVFHPVMMVAAWEALILERKVLVVTSTPSLLGPCCEFLKRITLPLVPVNLFVPHLPVQLIQAIEAPFPYLLGCNIADLRANAVDVSESVIIDLDARTVIPPKKTSANPNIRPPDSLIIRMREELQHVLFCPHNVDQEEAHSSSTVNRQIHELVDVFIRTNMSLFCARSCAVSAFYRTDHLRASHQHNSSGSCRFPSMNAVESKRKLSFIMGYNRKFKVSYGFMQLFHDRPDRKEIRHFIPCWVEMDDIVMSVYEFADDMPLFYIPVKDIESVAPSAIEPEGHVFEIVTKHHGTHCFAATDTESRRNWIEIIEEMMKDVSQKPTIPNQDSLSRNPSPFNREANGMTIENTADDALDDMYAMPSTSANELCLGCNTQSEEEEDRAMIDFRNHFMKTQMVSFLRSHVDASNNAIFKVFDGAMTIEIDGHEVTLKKFLCDDDSVRDVLHSIRVSNEDEFFGTANNAPPSNGYHGVSPPSSPKDDLENADYASLTSSLTPSDFSIANNSAESFSKASKLTPSESKRIPGPSGIMRFFRFGSQRDDKTVSEILHACSPSHGESCSFCRAPALRRMTLMGSFNSSSAREN
jgi:hypothetical protein